jgi:hypothetical protein
MVVFFPKDKSNFTDGQLLPLLEIPVNQGGEKVELNDFQWWAPTPKWDQWLKSHPRDWKAESEHPIFKGSTKEIFESLVDSGEIDPQVVSFSEFSSLMEEEGKEETGSEISEEEASKRFTKFVFAYNKLLKEGKIILNISFEKLQANVEYALILDLQGENGQDVEQSRNAYKFKPLQSSSSSKFVIGEIDETILTGKIPEDSSISDTLIKTGKIIGRVALGGTLAIAGVAFGVKVASSLASRMRVAKVLGEVIPGMKTVSTLGKSTWYFVRTLGGSVPFIKGAITAYNTGFRGLEILKFGAETANMARAAAGVGKGTNPVGWLITGAMAGQQLYNWFSDNQAPRYGEIEDEGVDAHDSFAPGSIPDGSEITVCWTQEAGQSGILAAIGNALVTNDTRTTMNLLKIGNFKGKALFYLINIHSEMYDKMLKENPTIFIAFDQNAKFEHGVFDNDDIEMEMIIPPGGKDAGAAAFFHGYCKWDEIDQAYKSSDDEMLVVPENAPKEYSFYFKSGKSSREVNVTGSLVENLKDAEKVKATFDVPEGKTEEAPKNESHKFEVFSFSEFQKISLNEEIKIFEEEEKSEDVETAQAEAAKVSLTEAQKVAAYEVTKIEFADSSLEGQDLPELKVFIVPTDYLEAEDNSSIKVDPVQNIIVKDPKRGSISIESEEAPEPVPVGIEGVTGATGPDIEGGVPVEITPDEVKIKYQDNPDALNSIGIPDVTKIKDKDKDDNIKLLDMITPEEKKDLDIEDWDYIKKVKIYKDGKTGEPIMIKFKSGGITGDRKRKIKVDDSNFDTALKVANRIQAGFHEADDKDENED